MSKDSRLVYSTETGRVKQSKSKGSAKASEHASPDGIVRIRRETSGRRGNAVTTITGVADNQLKPLAKKLKQACGSGGTAKNGVIEIQGDHRDLIFDLLVAEGFQVKRAGG